MTALGVHVAAHAHTRYCFFLLPVAQTGLLCCFSAGCGSMTSGLYTLKCGIKQVTGGEDEPSCGSETHPPPGAGHSALHG